ncbi:helicase [Mactra antiquata]
MGFTSENLFLVCSLFFIVVYICFEKGWFKKTAKSPIQRKRESSPKHGMSLEKAPQKQRTVQRKSVKRRKLKYYPREPDSVEKEILVRNNLVAFSEILSRHNHEHIDLTDNNKQHDWLYTEVHVDKDEGIPTNYAMTNSVGDSHLQNGPAVHTTISRISENQNNSEAILGSRSWSYLNGVDGTKDEVEDVNTVEDSARHRQNRKEKKKKRHTLVTGELNKHNKSGHNLSAEEINKKVSSVTKSNCDQSDDVCVSLNQPDLIREETTVTLSEMDTRRISKLLDEIQEAADNYDIATVKTNVLQVLVAADFERDKLITGLEVCVCEKELSEWYGRCSFSLDQVGETFLALTCFYSAILFDPDWNIVNHSAVSVKLWNKLVLLKAPLEVHQDVKKIMKSLAEMDKLAKLAEKHRKWHVCIAIDRDINRVLVVLRDAQLIRPNLLEVPGKRAALWRVARCYLKLGIYEGAKRMCSTILRDLCDYDNSEALEIWSKSLFATGEYELALEKCKLALKYCQDGGDRDRLENLLREIEGQVPTSTKKRELDEEWLQGTNADSHHIAMALAAAEKHKPPPNKKKRHRKSYSHRSRHNSPVQHDTAGNTHTLRSRSLTPNPRTRTQNQNMQSASYISKKQSECIEISRSRNLSSSSTATTITNLSSTFSAMSYEDYDITDSEEDQDETYTHIPTTKELDTSEEQDETTFYEKSVRFYQQNYDQFFQADNTDNLGKVLRDGVKLNDSYMYQFRDRPSDKEEVYTPFLDKNELKQKVIENPSKYVRGVLQIEGSNEAYCHPVDANANNNVIEICGRSRIGQAFNDDEVVVEILDKDKKYGKVLGLWERHRHSGTDHPVFICVLDRVETHLVRPLCKTIPKIHTMSREIRNKYKTDKQMRYKVEVYEYDEVSQSLENPKIVHLRPDELTSYTALVVFIKWNEGQIYPRGAIINLLNCGTGISTGLSIIGLQHEVPSLYTKETIKQVEELMQQNGSGLPKGCLRGRNNLTSTTTFTIDPPHSQDLDDALSIEPFQDGYKVGVHIADVSAIIPKDSHIDIDAKSRATTFYSGITSPRNMLPEPLSQNRLSLLPNEQRLTLSIFFYLARNGRFMQMERDNYEIQKTVIQSKRKLTYTEAQQIIMSPEKKDDDRITKDIRVLFKLAKAIRKYRLGQAMFALHSDWEESDDTEDESPEAHYLVEEFMILANKKVAEKLVRVYKTVVPLRCQPPPSEDNLQGFLKKNENYIDLLVQFQDKQIGATKRNIDLCLNPSDKSVVVNRRVWEYIRSHPKEASKYLRQDDIHPLQVAIYQHWLSIQERAGYRCSGSLIGKEDGKHFSLDMFPYTHFTSPIRRYNDIIVHRLIHCLIDRKEPVYTKNDIDTICVHSNSVMKRAKAFEKQCRSLRQAISFKENPKMITCNIDEVTDKSATLCSPMLKYVNKGDRDLPFNLLDMSSKPEVKEDFTTKWSIVKAVWRKRLYDFKAKPTTPPDRGYELTLNPNKGNVFIPLHEWAKLVKCAINGQEELVGHAIKETKVDIRCKGYDDVSTECLDPLKIQPNTKFSMTFSRGQTVHIQMTAASLKGVLSPKPMLYSMTNNVKLCLQHMLDPVDCLTQYASKPTCNQYKNVKEYLQRWLPLITMEAATGAVRNEESFCINNVQVKFATERRGKFALGLAECELRNIEFSGTKSVDDDDVDDEDGDSSYDWLCVKTPLNSTKSHCKIPDAQKNHRSVWVGHASVINVKKKKDSKRSELKLTVNFELHEKAPMPVPRSPDQSFDIEVLRKTEVARRTETFIKSLATMDENSLAVKIALNKHIPELDKTYKRAASKMDRDLTYDESEDDPGRKPLPRNNEKQQEAVDKAMMSKFSLIQGPPGTGKTYTGIKLIYLFNLINRQRAEDGGPNKQVLFCGPSNKSVDLVAEWMIQRMGKYTPNFVRIYGRSIEAQDFPIPGRTFLSKKSTRNQKTNSIIQPVALHYLIRKKGKKHAEEINALDKLFKANQYQSMPDEVRKYVHLVREASIDEIRKYDIILCTTAVGSNPKVLEATNVQQVIVDEAGMCPEPECLVPIIATNPEQVVLIGDHKQLRPIILCKEALLFGLETSLFERYATLNESETNSTSTVKFTMLTKQYRMNPQICRFPSMQFYKGSLITKGGPWCLPSPMQIWSTQRHKTNFQKMITYPHVLVHVEGEEKVLTVTMEDGNEQSRSNMTEIKKVIEIYKYITTEASGESIQILSQYNAQCAEIRRQLEVGGFPDVNVSTVVSSQGGEWDYVLFSTVRSLPDYKIDSKPTFGWCKRNLGFITDENQMNVALTRARKGLIIIGNKNLLQCDRVWGKLISYYESVDCIKSSSEFPPEITSNRMQRMTRNIRQNIERYRDTMFVKGTATSYDGDFDEDETILYRRAKKS